MAEKEIMSYEEFKQLDREKKISLLKDYEKDMNAVELAKKWGVHVSNVYSIRSNLGVSRKYKNEIKNDKTAKTEQKKEQIPNQLNEALHTTLSAFKPKNEESIKVINKVEELEPLLKIEKLENKIDHVFNSLKADIQRLNIQTEAQETNGITFQFNGKFTSKQLTKKLEKVLLIIDDENSEFEVDFKLREREQKEVIEVNSDSEEDLIEQNKIEELREELKSEVVDVVDGLKTDLKSLQEDLNKKIQLDQKYAEGYSALKSDKNGLHKPKSEFESVKKKAVEQGLKRGSVKIHNDQEKFQTYYICDDCGKKNKIYIPREVIYVNCINCGKRMRVKEATKGGFPESDTFGNFFIAGQYGEEPKNKIQVSEKEAQSLYDIWGVK